MEMLNEIGVGHPITETHTRKTIGLRKGSKGNDIIVTVVQGVWPIGVIEDKFGIGLITNNKGLFGN
jgi:hypothetical protein